MNDNTVRVLLCILAAAATAFLIRAFIPSRAIYLFRHMRATIAVRRAIAWCRRARDPAELRAFRYCCIMTDLESAIRMRDDVERSLTETFGPGARPRASALAESAMLERHADRCRERARRYLSAMDDADIASVARIYQRGVLKGKVPMAAVAEFFRDERGLARAAPHMVVGHFDRMEHRFNLLWEDVPEGMEAAAP